MSDPVSREFDANNVSLSLNNKFLRMEFNLLKARFEESQRDMQLKFQSLEAGQKKLLGLVQTLVNRGSASSNMDRGGVAVAAVAPPVIGRRQPKRTSSKSGGSRPVRQPTKKRDRSLDLPSTSAKAKASSMTPSLEDITDDDDSGDDDPKPVPRRSSRLHLKKPCLCLYRK